MEAISHDLIEDAKRILSNSSPIHRCQYCRQYSCDCPERLAEDTLAASDNEDEEELKLSGKKDDIIINPPIDKGNQQ